MKGSPRVAKPTSAWALARERGQRSAWGSGRQPSKFPNLSGPHGPPILKKRAFLWQQVFKCLCFSRKFSYQKKACTNPQSIKEPKSELSALAEAEEEGAGVHTLSTPLTPKGGPAGWNWGPGASGNLKVPMDSSILGFYGCLRAPSQGCIGPGTRRHRPDR